MNRNEHRKKCRRRHRIGSILLALLLLLEGNTVFAASEKASSQERMAQTESIEADSVSNNDTEDTESTENIEDTKNIDTPPIYGSIHSPQFKKATIRPGIDVSKWNGEIDWERVAETQDFAFVRVAGRYSGNGELYVDEYYEKNIEEAYAAGLDVGVYILSQAITPAEAKEEAQFLLKRIEPYKKKITLPLVFDYEFYSNGRLTQAKLSKKEHSSIVNKFCSTIEKAGYTACLYTNLMMIQNHYDISKINKKYTIWIARYNTQVSIGSLIYEENYDFWQYSSKGSVDGIQGNVDLNHQYVIKPGKINGFYVDLSSPAAITLIWEKQIGVYGYQVFRTEAGNEEFTKIATVRGASMTEYTDETAEQGIEYDYKVRAFYKFQKGNRGGTYSDIVIAAARILVDPVSDISETACTDSTITFSWEAPEQASGYELYRYDKMAEEYQKIATIEEKEMTEFTDEGLQAGKKYEYQIRPFSRTNGGNFIYYGASESAVLYTKLPATEELTVVEKGTDSLTLSWEPVKYASGYRIYQYDSKTEKYKRIAEVSGKNHTSQTITGLKADHAYRFKVAAYRTAGETSYMGTRSAALKVRTK